MTKLLNDVSINSVAINEHISTIHRMLDDEDYETKAELATTFLLRDLRDMQDALIHLQRMCEKYTS